MTNWQTGDVITAEKLNDLESRAGALIVNFDGENPVSASDVYLLSDCLFDDIVASYIAGRTVLFHFPDCITYSVHEGYATMTGYDPEAGFYPISASALLETDRPGHNITGITKDDTTGLARAMVYVD